MKRLEFKKNELDVHEIVKVGGIEIWIGDGAVLNNYVLECGLPQIWNGAPANIFKAKTGWIAFILDENESEWSVAHCYIPDCEHKLTLKQLLTALTKVREDLLQCNF